MAVLGLTAGALTAQAKPKPTPTPPPPPPIPISALPFTISAPGSYKVTANLNGSLWIATNVQGPIVLDLGGFTLSASGGGDTINNIGIQIGGFPGDPDGSNPYPITIQNGTISNCSYGIWVGANSRMSAVTIQNVTINILPTGIPSGNEIGILFERSQNSAARNVTINDPAFNSNPIPSIGIQDDYSPGGNVYNNVTLTTSRKRWSMNRTENRRKRF
jgi:hypothetical protein